MKLREQIQKLTASIEANHKNKNMQACVRLWRQKRDDLRFLLRKQNG